MECATNALMIYWKLLDEEVGMNELLKGLIGKTDKDLEKQFGFDFYLETKNRVILTEPVSHQNLVESFLEFNKSAALTVVELCDGTIADVVEVDFETIKENLYLLGEDEGLFYDEDVEISYGFLCDEYFALILSGIIFFSGKSDSVTEFSEVLDRRGIEHHGLSPISSFDFAENKPRKPGRNDPCHCGSGKKYKKCCLEKDKNLLNR